MIGGKNCVGDFEIIEVVRERRVAVELTKFVWDDSKSTQTNVIPTSLHPPLSPSLLLLSITIFLYFIFFFLFNTVFIKYFKFTQK
jgi:hypothetical protein